MFLLYTDGACQPNPGKGGWAFILYPETHPDKRVIKSGYVEHTTNNRMEIKAVLEGLRYIIETIKLSASPENHSVVLHSDSKYLLNGIKTWMYKWAKNNWKKKNNRPLLNDDFWKQIYLLANTISVECQHIYGHSGHSENEECDQLAVAEISKNKSS